MAAVSKFNVNGELVFVEDRENVKFEARYISVDGVNDIHNYQCEFLKFICKKGG
jgi:hypothetical protein